MKFGNVYRTIHSVVLSTATYLVFADKDFWNEHKAGIMLLTG
ncbi:MAG: hypothetical protein WBW12_14245 [Terriglobales bacterium]